MALRVVEETMESVKGGEGNDILGAKGGKVRSDQQKAEKSMLSLLKVALEEIKSTKKVEKETTSLVLRVVEVEIKSFKKADKETTPLLRSVEEVKSDKEVVEKASIDCVKYWRNSERNSLVYSKNAKELYRKNYVV